MNRRKAIKTAGAVMTTAAMASRMVAADQPDAKRKTIAMLLYPKFTTLVEMKRTTEAQRTQREETQREKRIRG